MGKQYDIKAQPTKYAGKQFDSKHEVRWVRFFEACGFEWEREPITFLHPKDSDLSWRPDLRIKHQDGREYLVEIKPLESYFGNYIGKTKIARIRGFNCLFCSSAPSQVVGLCRVGSEMNLQNLFPEDFLELWESTKF
jgi:hypothetical protein